jgi:4-hydroxybenzoate polyprenyltransferase
MSGIIKRFIETNLFIAVAAVAFLWANVLLLDLDRSAQYMLSVQVFFSTWFIYQLSRWIYFKKGMYANTDELVLKWFRKHPKLNLFTILLSGLLTIVFTCFLKMETIAVLFVVGLLSVLYPLPVFKPFGISTRLRDFPFIKLFLIALVWSVTSVLLPALESGTDLSARRDVYVVLVLQFIYILFITLPFDINDAIVDKTTGIQTIPTRFGIKVSKWISFFLGIIYALGILFVFMLENWRSIANIYLNESTIYFIWVLLILIQAFTFLRSDKAEKWIIKLIYDGSMVLYFLILVFTVNNK